MAGRAVADLGELISIDYRHRLYCDCHTGAMASAYHHKAQYTAYTALMTEKMYNAKLTAALDKVNLLSGMLPICANCKKIRDDKGYWDQLEHYITEHSEAEFTHGICPDCAKELYPDIKFSDK